MKILGQSVKWFFTHDVTNFSLVVVVLNSGKMVWCKGNAEMVRIAQMGNSSNAY